MVGAEYSVSILERNWLSDDTFSLVCSRPKQFSFVAGQHVTLGHEGQAREYSILASPMGDTLHFLIKRVDQGQMSNVLAELEVGTTLGMSKAQGYLVYRPTDRPVYFVANGVGIAPFVAMAAVGITGFTILHGARELSGLLYRKELLQAADRYIPCVSGSVKQGAMVLDLHRGRVTDYLDRYLKPGVYDFYLCGSSAMIHDVTHLLDQLCPGTRIYSESFT